MGPGSREFLFFSVPCPILGRPCAVKPFSAFCPSPCGRVVVVAHGKGFRFLRCPVPAQSVPVFQRWCSSSCALSPAPLWRPVSALGGLLLAGVLGCMSISSPPPLAGTCCLGRGRVPVHLSGRCSALYECRIWEAGAVLASGNSRRCTPTPPPRAAGLSVPVLSAEYLMKGVCQGFPLRCYI